MDGYILLTKPATLSAEDWRTVLKALYGLLGKSETSHQPSEHLHYRLSVDGTQVLIQACFDDADLDPADTKRLAKYISVALGAKYTPEQCATAMRANVTVWGGTRAMGAEEARKYLAANSKAWEGEEK